MTVFYLGKGEKFSDVKDALTSSLWVLFSGSEADFFKSKKDATALIRVLKNHGFKIVKIRKPRKK